MDVPSVEHSDSDSGESWTLLENNSVYADEAPEFIEEHEKHEPQRHEKDEDTDGISIISDSDHETPSPPPSDQAIIEKCVEGNFHSEENSPGFISISPHLDNINNNNQEPITNEDFLGDSHAKHKTYVHRRNKRLSTVLNIIVLGSVITAAGVAIGHMWGAKNDCTMQTTSSVNKILSNLYKLQEENAYLRSKLKEFTFINNNQVPQHKINSKYNKCKRVFEESLNSNDPRKLTKCVDEKYKNIDNLMEHLVKPKYEKEFVADIDKLKTVYLQNKSWLDDEISRRMKIEEELLKKYNNEVNSAKEQKIDTNVEKNAPGFIYSDTKNTDEEELDNSANFKIPATDHIQKKVTYADSLQTERIRRFKRDEKKNTKGEIEDWLNSEYNINNIEPTKKVFTSDADSKQMKKPKSEHDRFISDFLESAIEDQDNQQEQFTVGENWTEVKPKFRRNEERYESDYDKSFLKPQQKLNPKNKPKLSNKECYSIDDNCSKRDEEYKQKVKKDKRYNKQSYWENNNNNNRIIENVVSEEDVVKDDRYVVNKLKQEKKRNGFINSNKKQKRKIKNEKWNMKGEFGETYHAVETPEDFVLNYPEKNNINFDTVSFINNADTANKDSVGYKDSKGIPEKFKSKMEKNEMKGDNVELDNWFEKRAMFRKEARKKYYEQFVETSPNNSSWYFRRMRKREQCRAKGDNSTFRKFNKDKKNYKIKH